MHLISQIAAFTINEIAITARMPYIIITIAHRNIITKTNRETVRTVPN